MDQLLMMIQNATLMISNDTGPMHMAFSCKTPIICLLDLVRQITTAYSHPKLKRYIRRYMQSLCSEFSHPPCKGDNKCMQFISVAEVFYQVEYFLVNEHFILENEANISEVIYKADRHILGTVKR